MSQINVNNYANFIKNKEAILQEFSKIDFIFPENLLQKDITSILKNLEVYYRQILSSYGCYTPKFSYHSRYSGDNISLSLHRKHESMDYYNFNYKFFFNLADESKFSESIRGMYSNLFIRLAEEYNIMKDLEYYNLIFQEASLKAFPSDSILIKFVPNTFYSNYVRFISDNSLILVVDSTMMYKFSEKVNQSGVLFRDLVQKEFESLIASQSTVEILIRKTPLIKYLLNSGRTTIKGLMKGTFSKSLKQLRTYQKVHDNGLYLEDDVIGVVNRSEYGLELVLSPINTVTFLKEDTLNLIEMVQDGGNLGA